MNQAAPHLATRKELRGEVQNEGFIEGGEGQKNFLTKECLVSGKVTVLWGQAWGLSGR